MSLKIVSSPLALPAIAQVAGGGSSENGWFVPCPTSPDEWKRRASAVRGGLANQNWVNALAPAFDAHGLAAERLEKAAKSGIAVTVGQQPGLFGGPLYTWWKALSAVALADRLEEITGLPVVPVFWAATDDSDFAETASTLVAVDEATVRIVLESPGTDGRALSDIPIGDVGAQLEQLAAACGSAPHSSILRQLEAAYRPDRTVGTAYVGLLRELLEPLGIAVLDAAHPATRVAGFPVMRRALQNADAITQALLHRSSILKSAGYTAQVKVVKGRSLVFAENSGRRERIQTRDSATSLESAAAGSLGPNVLLRPIVERSIIPTVAYLGGPGEIAYFAQVSAVADALGEMTPLILPRWSGFVVEPRVAKILERHELTIENFRDPHAVESRIAREAIPTGVAHRIAELKRTAANAVSELEREDGSDIVSRNVLDGLAQNVNRRIDRLERRYAAAIKTRGNEALRDAAIARASLFPGGTPQERSLNIVPFIARYGEEVFEKVLLEARAHAATLA
ncbi:MAG TPA: bacillithiol biosynthesis cysteine-adding enzyme BshC [Gemmatimonadaceae bacterium]|nr:bacillithiol biosynthesis cysteine-adding enzyme BshC [Gemmatimonadaceae bacterium]